MSVESIDSPEIARIRAALKAEAEAANRFNNADPELADTVIHEYTGSSRRVSTAFREARSLFCPEGLEQATNRGKGCQE